MTISLSVLTATTSEGHHYPLETRVADIFMLARFFPNIRVPPGTVFYTSAAVAEAFSTYEFITARRLNYSRSTAFLPMSERNCIPVHEIIPTPW